MHLFWTPFKVPLRSTFATARLSMATREGLVVWLATNNGATGVGEASPLPPLSGGLASWSDTIEAVLGAVDAEDVEAVCRDLDEVLGRQRAVPVALASALRAGIDTAVCDLLARSAGVSVARFLAGDSAAAQVPVNALIHATTADRAAAEAAAAHEAGFETVKLKVGVASELDAEIQRVTAVREALGPGPRLRLDANGAWDPQRAIDVIRALESFDLELVEQPVPPGDNSALRKVRQAVATPIAADEAITGEDTARRVIEAGAADVLVVKPMVVGGVRPALGIVDLARNAGLAAIVTTTVDTGIGTAAALHLAAAAGPGPHAHGLATAAMLETDLLTEPLPVEGGAMHVPQVPGLGVVVDEGAIARHTTATP